MEDGMILKLIYSALLLGASGILLREFWTVWADPQVYVGAFEVVGDAEGTETGPTFQKRIVTAQQVLARQIIDYQRPGADGVTDATFVIPGSESLKVPQEALEGLDITIQNVNLKDLLAALRKAMRAPNEVRGHVTIRGGSVVTVIDWPRAPVASMTRFLTPSRPTPQESAEHVACSISWARGTERDARLGAFGPAQICDFATGLNTLHELSGKASQPGGLGEEQATLVRARAAQLRSHYSSGAVYAQIYRLRADLLDLLPEKSRSVRELVEAQEDRLRYAMLSLELRNLPEEEKRLMALAIARPAILLENGKPVAAPENWRPLLQAHEEVIRAAAASTGVIVKRDGSAIGTGFIVAPGLVMTMGYVLDEALRPMPGTKDVTLPRLCLTDSHNDCSTGASLAVQQIVYKDDASGIGIGTLVDHDPIDRPPLVLTAPLPEANTVTGRYAFVLGYPFHDARMPQRFIQELLGKDVGRRRVMPGRILAFGPGDPAGSLGQELRSSGPSVFTTDISTAGGTGGGPLVDLLAGGVLGVSYAGQWRGERGKFAYARRIPDAAVELIGRRLRGEAITPEKGGK
jgi:hypothetical protein